MLLFYDFNMSSATKSHFSFIYGLSDEEKIALQLKCDKIVQCSIPIAGLGCRIRPHKHTLSRYPQIYVNSAAGCRTVALSVCLFALANPSLKESISHYEVSHLCGRSNCINIAHLTAEPHAVNLLRKRCHRSRGGQRKHCCTHSPMCIL